MERARLSLAPSPLGPLPPLAGPPPQCRLLPLPTPAPSSGPPSPTARTLRPQPQPGSPTPASASYPDPPGSESQYSPWPGYLGTLARTRGPGHRLAEGRAAVAAPGRGRVGERGGGGSRSSANAPGRGNRASDVSVGAWPSRHYPKKAGRSLRHSHAEAAWGRVPQQKKKRSSAASRPKGRGRWRPAGLDRLTESRLPVKLHGVRSRRCIQAPHFIDETSKPEGFGYKHLQNQGFLHTLGSASHFDRRPRPGSVFCLVLHTCVPLLPSARNPHHVHFDFLALAIMDRGRGKRGCQVSGNSATVPALERRLPTYPDPFSRGSRP